MDDMSEQAARKPSPKKDKPQIPPGFERLTNGTAMDGSTEHIAVEGEPMGWDARMYQLERRQDKMVKALRVMALALQRAGQLDKNAAAAVAAL